MHKIEKIIEGEGLDEIIDNLILKDRMEKLEEMSDFFSSKELLIDGINKLQYNKIPTPEVDARILLSYAINYQNTIYMHNDISISKIGKIDFTIF